jgi:hypothetical protein
MLSSVPLGRASEREAEYCPSINTRRHAVVLAGRSAAIGTVVRSSTAASNEIFDNARRLAYFQFSSRLVGARDADVRGLAVMGSGGIRE